MVASLNYEGTEFPVSNVNVFAYKSNQAYTFYLSNMYTYI